MATTFTISITASDAAAELRSLLSWLEQDPELRGPAMLSPPVAQPSEMGTVSDVVVVVLDHGGVAALGGALCVWLRSRTSDVTTTISTEKKTVSIEAHRIKNVDEVLESLRKLTE